MRKANNINSYISGLNLKYSILFAIGVNWAWTGWYIVYHNGIRLVEVPSLPEAVAYIKGDRDGAFGLTH